MIPPKMSPRCLNDHLHHKHFSSFGARIVNGRRGPAARNCDTEAGLCALSCPAGSQDGSLVHRSYEMDAVSSPIGTRLLLPRRLRSTAIRLSKLSRKNLLRLRIGGICLRPCVRFRRICRSLYWSRRGLLPRRSSRSRRLPASRSRSLSRCRCRSWLLLPRRRSSRSWSRCRNSDGTCSCSLLPGRSGNRSSRRRLLTICSLWLVPTNFVGSIVELAICSWTRRLLNDPSHQRDPVKLCSIVYLHNSSRVANRRQLPVCNLHCRLIRILEIKAIPRLATNVVAVKNFHRQFEICSVAFRRRLHLGFNDLDVVPTGRYWLERFSRFYLPCVERPCSKKSHVLFLVVIEVQEQSRLQPVRLSEL